MRHMTCDDAHVGIVGNERRLIFAFEIIARSGLAFPFDTLGVKPIRNLSSRCVGRRLYVRSAAPDQPAELPAFAHLGLQRDLA